MIFVLMRDNMPLRLDFNGEIFLLTDDVKKPIFTSESINTLEKIKKGGDGELALPKCSFNNTVITQVELNPTMSYPNK